MTPATSIRLEASSHCQLRCPSCPTTRGEIKDAIGSGFLKLADFITLLDSNTQLKKIELSNYGEIFLNPDLLGILQAAHARGVALSSANGANFNSVKPEVLEGLVKYGVQELTISLDGASDESYSRYRVRGSFDAVLANVRELQRFKAQYQSETPRLMWQFIAFGHNQHEIPKARAMAEELGMKFFLKLSWDPDFSPLKDPEALRLELGVASRQEYDEKNGVDYMQGICHQLWDSPQVNWDGRILGCARNFWGRFGDKNAFTDGLEPSLGHEALGHARGMLLGQNPARADIPCTSCSIYIGMAARKHWLERPLPAQPPGPIQRLRSRLHLGRFLPWRQPKP